MAGAANPAMASNPYQQAAGAQQAALAATASGLGYSPAQINPAMRSAAPTAASQMGNYTNPYESQVVQAALRDVGGQAQQGFNQLDAQASQAGAFGGSRHGIAQAEMAKGYTQQMADTAARMRAQGFNTALGASQFDVGNQMNVNAANVAAINAAQQQNIANQMAGNQARLGAAQQLAGLGGQSFGYGQSIQNQQMQQGMMQQQQMQALIDAAKAQYGGYTQAPLNKLNLPLAALGQAPVPETQTQTRQLGLFDYLTAGAKLYAGM